MKLKWEGEQLPGLTGFQQYQLYNNLDSAVTAQLLPIMEAQLNDNTATVYRRERELQALCLEMTSNGFPIGEEAMLNLVHQLELEASKCAAVLAEFCEAIGLDPKPDNLKKSPRFPYLNAQSPQQLQWFFYDFLGIPPQEKWDPQTRTRKITTDRETLERLRVQYPTAAPFIQAILGFREANKLLGVFKRGLEPDGYLRCNFSPSGTETGRLSSSKNIFGRGTNAQNLNDRVRIAIEAPEGYILAYIDLKTAESIAVGFLSGDRDYIHACLSGDLHTTVCKMVWPHLPWTGDLKKDKEVAETPFYRDMTYRDLAKRLGHGTNYLGTPRTMARFTKVSERIVIDFQKAYFKAFPAIRQWHNRVIVELQRTGVLVNPLRRERKFWGHPADSATHREAVAFLPQSTVADVMNQGLLQVARALKASVFKGVRILAQVHDAGLFLIPRHIAHDVIPFIQQHLMVSVEFEGLGVMEIPSDATVGNNWAKRKWDKKKNDWKNKYGLRDYAPDLQWERLAA